MKRIGIVNVNLEYEIPKGQDPQKFLENVELPKEYVTDSFEIVKIMTIDKKGNTIKEVSL